MKFRAPFFLFLPGPATIRMVSTNSNPPMPMPLTVPAGHMVQQILGQDGTLQDVILALDPMAPPGSGPQPPPPPPPSVAAAGVPGATTPVSAAPFTPVGPAQGAALPSPYVSNPMNANHCLITSLCREVIPLHWALGARFPLTKRKDYVDSE